jgi:hypothetical protein
MSFKTDRPFYPYAEPGDQRALGSYNPGRLLRVFVLSMARMEGKLDHPTTTWPGGPAWAHTLSEEQRGKLVKGLGGQASLPGRPWLTVFDDSSSPRPGVADVFFSTASDQTTLARPPIIHYRYVDAPVYWNWQVWALSGLSVLLLGVFGLLVWKGRTAPKPVG